MDENETNLSDILTLGRRVVGSAGVLVWVAMTSVDEAIHNKKSRAAK